MMNKSEFWSVAHVDQRVLQDSLEYTDVSLASDMGWLRYLSSETPNGLLLIKNVLYDVTASRKVYLAHVTRNFASISESGKLLSSSGCLVGSIYCTPLIKEKGKLRLHNLGEYIISIEAPKFSQSEKDVALLLVELELPRFSVDSSIGIDYLKLGLVHFSVFNELNYLLSHNELEELKRVAINSIRKANSLLTILGKFSPESIAGNFRNFYKLYQQATVGLPILGYFLFEVLCEYIALFQQGEEVERYKELGEIYCYNFKNLIFSVCPHLTRSFNLGLFRPDFQDIIKYLKATNIIGQASEEDFMNYLVRRLHYLIESRLYYSFNFDTTSRNVFWQNMEWDFSYLQQQLTPLLGHTIHRLLRNMRRYPNFYFYFDQYKALQAWNYWNHSNVALPFNAVLPKGEIGINPANPYLKYQIFTTKTWQENEHFYVAADKSIPLVIEPRLAELNMLLMRKK